MQLQDSHQRRKRIGLAFAALIAVFLFTFSANLRSQDGTPAKVVVLEGDSETETPSGMGHHGPLKDPVELNGPIFVDWPQPQASLVFTGEMDGYLEPCGCAGLDNQKGGLMRRHSLIKQLQSKDWNPLCFDMGGLIRRLGPQAEIKYRYALESLVEMDYDAIGFGARELQLSSDAILYVLANLDAENNPLVSANAAMFGYEGGFSKRYRVVEAGGKRVGVTAVVGNKHQAIVENNRDITWQEPAAALQQVVPQLEAEQCDLLVLMVHGDPDEAAELARQFPQFDLVSTTGGAEEPPNRFRDVEGSEAGLIETGHKGMYTIVIGIYDDPEQPFRFQRVPLDHRFEDSRAMQQMMVEYQEELKGTKLAGLGLTGVKHPVDSFVGSGACADCHFEATEVFEKTPHSHATERIVQLDPPRHFDPECLSCHVTGWEPQEYFPYMSGFMGLEETPHLTGNGCENCHGPGAAHVAAESGEVDTDQAELERLRARMRMEIVENEGNKGDQKLGTVVQNCLECHDIDNSPDFDFQEYWPKVKHTGKY